MKKKTLRTITLALAIIVMLPAGAYLINGRKSGNGNPYSKFLDPITNQLYEWFGPKQGPTQTPMSTPTEEGKTPSQSKTETMIANNFDFVNEQDRLNYFGQVETQTREFMDPVYQSNYYAESQVGTERMQNIMVDYIVRHIQIGGTYYDDLSFEWRRAIERAVKDQLILLGVSKEGLLQAKLDQRTILKIAENVEFMYANNYVPEMAGFKEWQKNFETISHYMK